MSFTSVTDRKVVSNILKTHRTRNRKTIAEMARVLTCSTSSYYQLEQGRGYIHPLKVKRLFEYYNLIPKRK